MTIDNFSFSIQPRVHGKYKSISNMAWKNVPGFAILTGRNGSGKTQLLEILAYHFSKARPQQYWSDGMLPVVVETEGVSYEPHEIAFVPSGGRFSGGTPSSISNMQNLKQQALQHIQQSHAYMYDINATVRASRLKKALGTRNPHDVRPEEIDKLFGNDFEFAIDDIDITTGITHLFVAHRLKILQKLEQKQSGASDLESSAPAPWEVVNDALAVSGFPYEVISPQETDILQTYTLRMRDKVTKSIINAVDLSSGEKVLLQIVLWLFTAGKDGLFPKLLLLDEPDAHLHPSMTDQFLDVISEVLVKKYSVRVIITSHSPSTVALAPEGSVFQLERGGAQVTPVANRADIISVLTAGLVTVSRATKFCFVEDEADVSFYSTVYDILTDFGPSKDAMALNLSPTIAFIPASIGSGKSKISGGCSVVEKWIDRLDADPLDRIFHGIIDHDGRNAATSRVHVIGRYSFENYMLDPPVLFALMLENGSAPSIPGLKISSGDEHLLRGLSNDMLQAISDRICIMIEGLYPSINSGADNSVNYTCGSSISVPSWVICHRGHDLLPMAQAALGGYQLINPPRLQKALRRCRLIPVELANLLSNIQTY